MVIRLAFHRHNARFFKNLRKSASLSSNRYPASFHPVHILTIEISSYCSSNLPGQIAAFHRVIRAIDKGSLFQAESDDLLGQFFWLAQDGRHIDNDARTSLEQSRNFRLHTVEDLRQVDQDQLLPGLGAAIRHRVYLAANSCIIEGDIQPTVLGNDCAGQSLAVLRAGYIGAHKGGRATGLFHQNEKSGLLLSTSPSVEFTLGKPGKALNSAHAQYALSMAGRARNTAFLKA